MSSRKALLTLILLILISNPSVTNITSLETGEVHSILNEIDTSIPITIQIWGFDEAIGNNLLATLPDHMVQEAYYPKDPTYDQLQINIDGNFFGVQNNIKLTIKKHNSTEFDDIISGLTDLPRTAVNSPINSSEIIKGRPIPAEYIAQLFQDYTIREQYNIHLVNFSILNNVTEEKYHWFNVGETQSILTASQDMRNTLDLWNRSILYDPTAIAPFFGFEPENLTYNIEYQTISKNILNIIEQGIVGSPMSYWYTPVEREFHIARVVIGTNIKDRQYIIAANPDSYDSFSNQVSQIFPGFDLAQSYKNVNLEDIPSVKNYLEKNTINIDGEPSIVVDSNFAEVLKNAIRKNYYTDYPSRYYIGFFLFADSERNYYTRVDGKYSKYNVGELGFAMDSLGDWYTFPSDATELEATSRLLFLLGENFGLAKYNYSTTMQFDSPMSTYGVSSNWNREFTPEERDAITRRYSAIFRTKLSNDVSAYIDFVNSKFVPDYDISHLEKLRDRIQIGKASEERLNYTSALTTYLGSLNDLDHEIELITNSRNLIYYGTIMISALVVLGYYSKIMMDDSFSKEEFKRRVRKLREHNIKKLDD